MCECILTNNIEIEFKKYHKINYTRYFIKRQLENNVFGLGQIYLLKAPFSFSVIKVQTATHVYEFVKETSQIKVTDKQSNESYISDEIYEFKAAKNCQYIIPRILFKIPEIFGLDKVEIDVKFELNTNNNRCVILHGPDGCCKRDLMKKLSNIMDNKIFIWLDYRRFGKENDYIEILSRNIQKQSKPMVLCIDNYESVLYYSTQSDLFHQEIISLLDNSEIDLKILLRVSDIDMLKSIDLLKRSTNFFVKIIDKKSRFELIKYLIRQETGCQTFEDGLESFSNRLNNFTVSNIDMFMKKVHSDYKELTVEQLEACRKDQKYIPDELLSFVADSEPLHWDDIGGYDGIKHQLQWSIENRIKNNRLPTKGVLFYGPPGCSKTMFVRALATECSLNLFSIKPSTVLRGYVGESEKLLKEILMRAKASAPSILFIDEIDMIFPRKESLVDSPVTQRMLNELLVFLNGIESNSEVIFIAATNFPDKVDSALVRDGRINLRVHVDLPDKIARESILKIVFSDENFPVNNEVYENLSEIARKLEGLSGAGIVNFGTKVKQCARFSLPEDLQFTLEEINIDMCHVEECLSQL